MFRVGDTVRCIEKNEGERADTNPGFGGSGWEKGFTFKIRSKTDLSDIGRGNCYWDGVDGCGVHESHLELVKGNSLLRKGDIVNVLSKQEGCRSACSNCFIGRTAKIREFAAQGKIEVQEINSVEWCGYFTVKDVKKIRQESEKKI